MKIAIALVAAAAALASAPVHAKTAPLLDCAGRDAPLSLDSPLVDLMLSPAGKALVLKETGKDLAALPAFFSSTTPPTFGAILTVRSGLGNAGVPAAQHAALDAKLRALPVTRADKAARCARYDNDRITLPRLDPAKPRLLLFSKINGFRDGPSVEAAKAAMTAMAQRKGWQIVATEKGGAITPQTLAKFDAVIWNNVSGDVLTLSQRKAFQDFVTRGGGYVGIHGSSGDPAVFWEWYADRFVGARFAGHPSNPQFQEARIAVNTSHPLAAGLPGEWRMTDEWYSFRSNPRDTGVNVLLTLDESTYTRFVGPGQPSLDMGADHPIAWTRCVGKGRMFYSAIGHMPQTYDQPQNVRMLENAVAWAANQKSACR